MPRTVSALTASTISHSTSRSASSRSVHFAHPSGGSPQAIATSRASASPSRTFGRRLTCGRRFSAASMPSSTQRRRTRATVAMPVSSASAISPSMRPPSSRPSSHCSRMRACVCLYAAVRPFDTSAFSPVRSSAVRRTRYFFADIRTSLSVHNELRSLQQSNQSSWPTRMSAISRNAENSETESVQSLTSASPLKWSGSPIILSNSFGDKTTVAT